MTSRTTVRLIIVLVLTALPASAAPGPEAFDFEVIPRELGIDLFFAGSAIEVSGTADASLEIAVEVFGPQKKGRFHLKRQVGPLWMNAEEIELDHAPHLYILLTSDSLPPEEDLVGLGLGLTHVENKLAVRPLTIDKDVIFQEFLKLKRAQGLYGEDRGAVTYGSPSGGTRGFHAHFQLPTSTAPGTYEILATGFSADGTILATTRAFEVEEVGVIKAIHDFAFDHGLVYGVFCVVIALGVGGVMGVFFRRSGAH